MAIALLQADAPKFCPNALRGILRSLFWIWTRHHNTSNNPICHILIDNWCVLLMNNCRYSIRKYPSWNLNTCELTRIGAFSCFMRIFIILLCRNGIPDSSSWIYAFFYRLNLIIRILLFSGTRTYEIIWSSEYFCCLPWNDKTLTAVFLFFRFAWEGPMLQVWTFNFLCFVGQQNTKFGSLRHVPERVRV